MDIKLQDKYTGYIFFFIILFGAGLRFYFYLGHVFSDDAYFSYLSYTLYAGDFGKDYIGYPVSLLRINLHLLTAFAFKLFGPGELSASFFPMMISLTNLFLVCFMAKMLTNSDKIALIALLLMALFPTDIVFAGLDFADSFSAFFINLGLFFLFLAHKKNSIHFAILGGIFLAVSVQFKINVFFVALLMGVLLSYDFWKRKKANKILIIALTLIFADLLIEGLIYYKLHGDFLYRFRLTEQNYLFGKNDFFVKGSLFGYATEGDYWPELLKTLFISNPRAVFLRRFLLFLPLIALLQSIISVKKKEHRLIVFWFLGLSFLYIFFTSSFSVYRPLVQRFTWYIYPLFMPAVILSAIFVYRRKKMLRAALLLLYLAGSLLMCRSYETFFNKGDNEAFKSFLKENKEIIYTDHFTKYSIDLLDGYRKPLRSRRIQGPLFDLKKINRGELVVYHNRHIKELQGQGYEFPDFSVLEDSTFITVFRSGDFVVYMKD